MRPFVVLNFHSFRVSTKGGAVLSYSLEFALVSLLPKTRSHCSMLRLARVSLFIVLCHLGLCFILCHLEFLVHPRSRRFFCFVLDHLDFLFHPHSSRLSVSFFISGSSVSSTIISVFRFIRDHVGFSISARPLATPTRLRQSTRLFARSGRAFLQR